MLFFNGTFKRCPGFVTLACHIYMGIIGQIVKLFTMETESECVALCWKPFLRGITRIF